MFKRRTNTPEAFWKWFTKTDRLGTDGHALVQQVGPRLKDMHASLTLEVSLGQAPRHLIISADGIREAASFVDAIVDAAPPMPGWTITRFRPRRDVGDGHVLNYEDVDYDISAIRVGAAASGALVDLHVFVPWREDVANRAPDGPTFIALDTALGEWVVMMCIGEIVVRPLANTPKQTVPLNRAHELVNAILESQSGGTESPEH